ncbi:transcription mediator complex subunit Med12-domain-containing protein [Syncephalis plumigaleata]|nr:transcription mediator complex subunit Med12-domain-containing protein [Syncephalis plumigaleata]
MGHFSYNRPTPYTSIGTGSSVGSGTPGVSHLSAFAAQASALSGHARTSHGSRHPATGSPSQMSVASPPPNATTSSGRRHEQMPPITRYRLTPPKMLPPLHNEQANEYPDYYPHRSDQPEYQLNTQVIQQGYKATAILENESMSARNILCDHWKNTNTLTALEEFLTDVARQQTRSTRLPRESSWRPPTKYRVSDLKKEQWLLDLSNVSVPLHALAHSIPTGLKGEKLLEALATRQPPLVRAIWSIKVTSLADLDTGSTFTLSLELKNTLAQFLEAQLAELAGGPRTTSTPSMGYMTGRMVGNAFRPWQNEESRNRWTSRWWYSTRLAESLHNEGLVDQRHFLKWILDRLATSGLEQTVVLLPLVLALLDDIIRSRALSRILINALLEKLQTVFRLSETEGKSRRFQHAIDEIAVTLQLICIRWPDAIVQPKSWHRYELTLKRLSSSIQL